MCGIVGYIGSRACASILVEGLRKLEYRGYDSAGLAILDTTPIALGEPAKLQITRAVGKLQKLDDAIKERPTPGTVGIGHTRWATHGRPTEANAHPHAVGDVAVVHNGILENHVELRKELMAQGRKFLSETDTEIAAHLIDLELKNLESSGLKPTLLLATKQALARVRGAYAIAVVSRKEPDVVVVAKSFSPLVLGIGDGELFAASDVPALLAHTRDVIFLEDGDIAELRSSGYKIERLLVHGDGASERFTVTPVVRNPKRVDWSPTQAEKQGFKHFMLKEIHEQPTAIENTLRGRVLLDECDINEGEIGVSAADARAIKRVVLIACGTSHHAAIAGRNWIESIAKVPAQVELASELVAAVAQALADEPAVIGWALTNEAPLWAGVHEGRKPLAATVLTWAERMIAAVRAHSPLPIGLGDGQMGGFPNAALAARLDFVAPHVYYGDPDPLRQGLRFGHALALAARFGRPLLLEEFGGSSSQVGEHEQAALWSEAIFAAFTHGAHAALGWCWSDFPVESVGIELPYEHHGFELG
ncbi:MAG: isomerizing glutamine--fructose-6-phosphate transaminase, partial [Polyangiales bacterium]